MKKINDYSHSEMFIVSFVSSFLAMVCSLMCLMVADLVTEGPPSAMPLSLFFLVTVPSSVSVGVMAGVTSVSYTCGFLKAKFGSWRLPLEMLKHIAPVSLALTGNYASASLLTIAATPAALAASLVTVLVTAAHRTWSKFDVSEQRHTASREDMLAAENESLTEQVETLQSALQDRHP